MARTGLGTEHLPRDACGGYPGRTPACRHCSPDQSRSMVGGVSSAHPASCWSKPGRALRRRSREGKGSEGYDRGMETLTGGRPGLSPILSSSTEGGTRSESWLVLSTRVRRRVDRTSEQGICARACTTAVPSHVSCQRWQQPTVPIREVKEANSTLALFDRGPFHSTRTDSKLVLVSLPRRVDMGNEQGRPSWLDSRTGLGDGRRRLP